MIRLLLPLFLVSLLACDSLPTVGPRYASAKQSDLRARYHQGACFGNCEVYAVELYATGLLVFTGQRYTDKAGVWEKNIDRGAARAFLDSMARMNFADLPRSYPSRLPDMATTTVTYLADDRTPYASSFKEEASPELRRVQQRFQTWAAGSGWKQVSEATKVQDPDASPDRGREIIVRLQEGADAGAWLVKYGKQGVTLKQRISPNSPYYLITANPNLMSATELLKYLRQDEEVISAQMNSSAVER